MDVENQAGDEGPLEALRRELVEMKQAGTFPFSQRIVEQELVRLETASFLFNSGGVEDRDANAEAALAGPLLRVFEFMNLRDLHLYQRVSPFWQDICQSVLTQRLRSTEQHDEEFYIFDYTPQLPVTFGPRDRNNQVRVDPGWVRPYDADWIGRYGNRRNFVVTITFRTSHAGDNNHFCLLYTSNGGPMIDLNGWHCHGLVCFSVCDMGDGGYERRLDFRTPCPGTRQGFRYNDGEEHTLKAIMEYPHACIMMDGRVVSHSRARFNRPFNVRNLFQEGDHHRLISSWLRCRP